MSIISIKVENVSKLYKLGEIGTGTISHDLNKWYSKTFRNEDTSLKIGQINDRTIKGKIDEYVWALKDISFEINKGEIVGLIGSNGAGKSTILKILSKITKPTTGNIYLNGKVSSLLEVGTGFHPEMTGRENVFMNGAILGMKKVDIIKELDSIIEFSGVEKYIDTPIKRYSTGMKVRLGFAVAAHLNQEILIVDEVLAVGDAEFQKKCLGSMQNVGRKGRTVLFVSHNMAAIKSLCNRTVILDKGLMLADTNTEKGIQIYLESIKTEYSNTLLNFNSLEEDNIIRYEFIHISQRGTVVSELSNDEDIDINIGYWIKERVIGFRLIFFIYDLYENLISTTYFDEENDMGSLMVSGKYETTFKIPANILIDGNYKVIIKSGIHNVRMCLPKEGIILDLAIVETGIIKRKRFSQSDKGVVVLPVKSSTKKSSYD